MPPWEGALSDAERWDVALYAYTLELMMMRCWLLGERLWREVCGDCALPALIPPVYSDADYGALLNADRFGAALTDAEAAAAMAYARMTSLVSGSGLGAVAAGASAQLGPFLVISGAVVHGTAGGALPGDTIVQLRYGNVDEGFSFAETSLSTAMAASNSTVFPWPTGSNTCWGRSMTSGFSTGGLGAGAAPRPADALRLTVYDETNDPFVLSVARIDLFIEPLRLDDLGAGLAITQMTDLSQQFGSTLYERARLR